MEVTRRPSCDHLEEQIAGVRQWGKHFIASRIPARIEDNDPSLWQIYASEDQTTIHLFADDQISGLPPSPFTLEVGEVREFYVDGNTEQPGDFEVLSDKSIALLN